MVTVELLLAGLIVVLVALLAGLVWVTFRRHELRGSITEAQARENATPLTAILTSGRRERTGL